MSLFQSSAAFVAAALKRDYGIEGEIKSLPGEYDLNFDIRAASGRYVFKVMRADCAPDFVRMQIEALAHLHARGLADATPAVIATRDGRPLTEVRWEGGTIRIGWLISFLPGTLMARLDPVTPADAASIGTLLGRLDRALRDFDHPLLDRPQKWDLRQSPWIRDRLDAIEDARRREQVERIAARFAGEILPRLDALERMAVHNDANEMNLLFSSGTDGRRRATGIVDFGDMVRTPRVCEAAVAMAYAMLGPGDPVARGAALAGAYHREWPLSDAEISLLASLVEMRLAVSVTNSSIEMRERPDNRYLQISAAPAWRLLDHLADVGAAYVADHIRAACESPDPSVMRATTKSLLARRRRVAPGNQTLFYDEPLRIVRGRRHFLYDADGVEYLDVYNNVAHVGHAHPAVVEAAARQMSLVNTNTRYLQDVHVEYAERMLARMPPALTRIVFLNSASEANELALRLARAATDARDTIVMDHCYHGATTGAMDLSPYKFNHPKSLNSQPDWVHVAAQPDPYRGRYGATAEGYVADFRRVLDALAERGRRVAGFISECLPSVGGQIVLPDGYLKAVYDLVRAAGGVAIADDVQTALGRLGHFLWGFEQQDAVPDIAVMGKPLGNGYPLAAVAMTERIADAFAHGPEFFSTFGGSSASCAVGAAVLDVLNEENLQENARRVGDRLLEGLRELATRHEIIGDVRGYGFFLGVELVTDRATKSPATAAAARVKNGLRARRILLGVEGPDDNVLKIRPPMTFDDAAADRLLDELDTQFRQVR